MKKLLLVCLLPVVLMACQKEDVELYVDPTFVDPDAGIDKIAVLPFGSSLHHADDPDGIAPETMEKHFVPYLDARADYTFVSPNTVRYAIEREGWSERYEKFLDDFAKTSKPDVEFLGPLTEVLKVDAFLLPVVDLWQKDEVDIQENSAAATYVGATITVIDAKTELGAVLFRATKEDYLEGARSETSDRSVVRSAGRVRSDTGGKMYAAPPFDEVAARVAEALALSLPTR